MGVPMPSKIPAGEQRTQFLRLVEAKVASGGGVVSIPVILRRQASWEGGSQAASDTVQVCQAALFPMCSQRLDPCASAVPLFAVL
jgi:hypothetical protein